MENEKKTKEEEVRKKREGNRILFGFDFFFIDILFDISLPNGDICFAGTKCELLNESFISYIPNTLICPTNI